MVTQTQPMHLRAMGELPYGMAPNFFYFQKPYVYTLNFVMQNYKIGPSKNFFIIYIYIYNFDFVVQHSKIGPSTKFYYNYLRNKNIYFNFSFNNITYI